MTSPRTARRDRLESRTGRPASTITSGITVLESEREELKKSFGTDAAGYERARPRYPSAVVEFLCTKQGASEGLRVLEVGCGSGQATGLFVPISSELLGVDISGELLSIARERFSDTAHVSFLETSFEEVDVPPGHFDLVVSAQAFHWLDLDIALPKAARVLRSDGLLALFWNFFDFEAHPFLRTCREIILEHAPRFEMWPDSSRERFSSYRGEWLSVLKESGGWTEIDARTLDYSLERMRADFDAWITSLSWYRTLEPSRSSALREALANVASEDSQALPVRTLVLTARPASASRHDGPKI